MLGVTEILCCFKLVLAGKTGKEIPESSRLEFLEKFSANNFALSDAKDNTSRPLNRFTFVENTISNLPKFTRAKFLVSNWHFCFISMWKFGSFRNHFATITGLSQFCFRIRRFIHLVKTKKVISMNYGSSTGSWKPWRWVRLNLIFSMGDIYPNSNLNPLTKLTSSSRSNKVKDILP